MDLYSVGDIFDDASDGILICQENAVSYLNQAGVRLLSACGVALDPKDPMPPELNDLSGEEQLVVLESGLLSVQHRPFPALSEDARLYTLRSPQPQSEVSRRLELIARHLRGPLSSTLSVLDGMETAPGADHSEKLASLRRSHYRLLHTVNELQLLSDLCGSETEYPLRTLDLGGLVRELVWELDGFLGKLPFRLELKQSGNLLIQGSSPLLRQLLLALTSNAIAGGGDLLTITTKKVGRQAMVTLRDNGRGISPQQLAYARYPLLSQSLLRSELSAGLPICYRIAQIHGGSLMLQSDDTGTSCTLTFPLTAQDIAPEGLALECPFGSGCEDLFAALSEVVPDELYRMDNLD